MLRKAELFAPPSTCIGAAPRYPRATALLFLRSQPNEIGICAESKADTVIQRWGPDDHPVN
jgi:hypothetical protein